MSQKAIADAVYGQPQINTKVSAPGRPTVPYDEIMRKAGFVQPLSDAKKRLLKEAFGNALPVNQMYDHPWFEWSVDPKFPTAINVPISAPDKPTSYTERYHPDSLEHEGVHAWEMLKYGDIGPVDRYFVETGGRPYDYMGPEGAMKFASQKLPPNKFPAEAFASLVSEGYKGTNPDVAKDRQKPYYENVKGNPGAQYYLNFIRNNPVSVADNPNSAFLEAMVNYHLRHKTGLISLPPLK